MAHRERYERNYSGGVSVVLMKVGDRLTFDVVGVQLGPHAPAVLPLNNGQAHIDTLVGQQPACPWRFVKECFVCLANPVEIQRVVGRDSYEVVCPNCGTHKVTGVSATGCQPLHDTEAGREQMADIARYLKATAGTADERQLSTTTFGFFEQEGRRLRR